MNRLLLVAFWICASACTDDSGSRRALGAQGFTNIQLDGWEPFDCGKDDTFSTGFHATNPAGHPVSGVVCCGVLKACTVRF